MSLLAVGLSHRTAPVSLLERAALTGDYQLTLLREAIAEEPIAEVVLLSTCNRVEMYADADKFHAGLDALTALFSRHSGIPLDELTEYLYVQYEDRAVHHLFSVACGLDSMVVGEGQILAQLKDALALAQGQHTAGRLLNELFQKGLRVGKRAHHETGIDRAGQSLVSVGLRAVEEAVGALRGKRALVIGAGSMSALAAATLSRSGVADLAIANRTEQRAQRLANSLGARSIPFEDAEAAMADVDLVVSCTGATGVVLDSETVATACERRVLGGAGTRRAPTPDRQAVGAQTRLAILDLAMPRDVEYDVRELPGVALVDLERLADADSTPVAEDVRTVRALVAEEVEAFGAAQRAATITPTVVALRTMAADVVGAELERLDGRVPAMEGEARAEVEQTVRRVVDKLLHAPTVRVKQLAGEPGGAAYADALRKLFDLSPRTVAAVGTPGEAATRTDTPQAGSADPGATGVETADTGVTSAEAVGAESPP